ncbi:DinB family protein [Fimbriimonas ginsengisoli]|nr:DinB family protein [Fimbriimonas ginsengisoli]
MMWSDQEISMAEVIQRAKQEFEQSRGRMMGLLKDTPDDKLNWSPSPTARSPLAIVAHAGIAVHNITEMLQGRPFGASTSAIADKGFRKEEQEFTSRDEVVALFEKNAAAYVAWIDTLTEEGLNDPITFPFGLGTGTVLHGLTAAARHTEAHIAQLEYVQTIYGDQDWHMGI